MARNRLKGKSITFTIDEVDYTLDANSVLLTQVEAENDTLVFADADNGGAYEWRLNITALQSTDADALHTFMWDNAGTEADFVFGPHGNAIPSASQPHYEGTVKLPNRKPDIGGAADSTWTFSQELEVDGEVTKVTTGA